MSFSENIIKLRKERNWTQQQLAEQVGITVNQIKRYEKGRSEPSLKVVRKLAVTLGISADDLIFDSGEGAAVQRLDPELLSRFEKISGLPRRELEAVEIMLDGIILKNQLNDMIATNK